LNRRNYSAHTVKRYLNDLKQFLLWVDVPVEQVCERRIAAYIDHLLDGHKHPKTINCHLTAVRKFYEYLQEQGHVERKNPVKRGAWLRMPKPLPKYLKDEQIEQLLASVKKPRDRAIFILMLRAGLRVSEVASLTFADMDFRNGRLLVRQGKGSKDRLVYMSKDFLKSLTDYVRFRSSSPDKHVFLVEKGTCRGKGLSVRGIQKRMEYYARKAGLQVSLHQLRHTMATNLLNAGAHLATVQDLLGHASVLTTQRYCKVSNLRVQQDYYKAMEKLMQSSDGKLPSA
jgi:site-specific recombinase XerD